MASNANSGGVVGNSSGVARRVPLPVKVLGTNVIIRDFYSVNPPYAHVAIYVDPEGIVRYHVIEPPLTGREVRVIDEIKEIILDEARLEPSLLRSYDRARAALEAEVDRVIRTYGIRVPRRTISKIKYYIVRDFIGYGPLDPIYRDPYVEDITCIPRFEYVLVFINGKPIFGTAEEVFNTIMKFSRCIEEEYGIVKAYPQVHAEALALDLAKGKIVKSRIIFAAKRPAYEGRILVIKLEGNRVFYVTPYHPVFIIDQEGLKLKRAKDVKKGDFVIVARKLDIPYRDENKPKQSNINLIELFAGTRYESKIKVYSKHIPRLLQFNEIKKLNIKLKRWDLANWRRQKSMPLKVYLRLRELNPIARNIERDLYLTAGRGSRYKVPAIIELTKELGRIIGYYLSEGYMSNNAPGIFIAFGKHEKELIDDCKKALEKAFHIPAKVNEKETATVVSINSRIIEWLFKDVWKVGRNSYEKTIPNFVFKAPKWLIREVIKGLFAGDGYYNKYKDVYSLVTVSPHLAYGLIYLLLRLGIPFTAYTYTRKDKLGHIEIYVRGEYFRSVIIEGKDPEKLLSKTLVVTNRIPSFAINVKEAYKVNTTSLRKHILQTVKNGRRLTYKTVIKAVEMDSNILNEKLGHFILSSDVAILRVSEIKEIAYTGYVYDFKVKEHHNFVHGMGIITHNCDGYGLPIYVYHRDYEWMPTNVVFPTPDVLDRFIRRLAYRAGQSITFARPIVEGPLPPEGFRVHLTLGEVSRRGSTFTIRKYSVEPFTIVDLLRFNTLSPTIAAYYWLLVDNIQSMMIAGPMASGKSVCGDEYTLAIVDGIPKVLTFNELWNILAHKTMKVREYDVVDVNNISTLSLNIINYKLDSTSIGAFIRHKAPDKLYLVKTRLGRQVKVTGDHSLLVLDGTTGAITVKTPREIRVGVDYLILIGKIKVPERDITLQEIIRELIRSDIGDNIYVALVGDVKQLLDKFVSEYGSQGTRKLLNVRISSKTKAIRLKTLYKLIELTRIKPRKILVRSKTKSSPIYDLEKLVKDPDFARLIGYYIAEGYFDGHSIKIASSDQRILDDIIKICEKLNIPYNVVKSENKVPVVNIQSVVKWVIVGLDVGRVAKEKALPSIFFVMPKEWKANLLKGYFSGDGTVDSKGSIEISTISRKLAHQLIYALAVFGIHPWISVKEDRYYRLGFSLHYARIFVKEIGFVQEEKNEKIVQLLHEKYDRAEHDVIPNILLKKHYRLINKLKKKCNEMNIKTFLPLEMYSGLSRNRLIVKDVLSLCDGGKIEFKELWKLVESDVIFSKVISVEEVVNDKNRYVYDFEIPLYQNFIAGGGIIVHNTTLLNAIAMLIRPEAKIVTIEDTPEIRLPHENWVPLITRPSFEPGVQDVTLFDLLKSALRQRPEFIIVGEIRGEEAYTFFQALAVGHGGLCLPAYEKLPAIVDGRVGLYRIGDIVDGLIEGHFKSVKVLTYDVKNGKTVWTPITKFIKMRESNKFVKLKIEGGIEAIFHEKHPVIVATGTGFVRKFAKDVDVGDYIPILEEIPIPEEENELDLIDYFANSEFKDKIYVIGAEDLVKKVPSRRIYSVLKIPKWKLYEYRHGKAIPLKYYLEIEKLYSEDTKPVRRKLYLKYGGKARRKIPAVLELSRELGYLVGLYLADGSINYDDKDKLPRRVTFYVDEKLHSKVISALNSIGIDRESIRVRRYQKTTIPYVVVDNKLFAILLYKLLEGKVKDHERVVPLNIALKAPKAFREGIIEGYWDGDGSIVHRGKNACNIMAETVNRELAESIALLAKTLGIHISIYETDNTRGMFKGKPIIYVLKVLSGNSTRRMLNFIDPPFTITVTKSKIEKKKALKKTPNILYGKVISKEEFTDNVDIYDFEVSPYGNFAITSRCIITSNCTIHGETVEAVISRLESKPMNIPRVLIPLMKVITLTGRVKGPTGIVRRVIRVTEIVGIDPRTNEILLNDVFRWDPTKDSWTYSGRSYLVETISENRNIPLADVIDDLRRRSVILKWMLKKELRKFSEVAKVVRSYYQDPERVYAEASSEVEEVQLVWA